MPLRSDASDPSQKLHFLGLAFAGADLVFEVDAEGVITFALGASERLVGVAAEALAGRPWSDLVSSEDADLLAVLVDGLRPAERQGPLKVALKPRPNERLTRYASLSVARLPQLGGSLSCALSLGGPAPVDPSPHPPHGLMDQASFTAAAESLLNDAERAGLPLRLHLIELRGFEASLASLDADAAESTRRRLAATLRVESLAGLAGSEIGPDRYAVLRPAEASSARLAERLQGVSGSTIPPLLAELSLEGASPSQNLRAMRYALDRYIEDGPLAAAEGFHAAVARTVKDTNRFKTMLAQGAFHLAYQPVVDLRSQALHHFEALARFEPNSSPADTIRLAEELDLIADFDLAVAHTVAQVLRDGDRDLKIAVNVSAVSLMQPRYVAALLALTAAAPDLRPRMLLEITETHHLADLPKASRVLAALKQVGHKICLDDFGAGGASLDYLRQFDVDIVKIDGRYLQGLEARPRDGVLLKHVVALCRDLGVSTIGEMIETADTAAMASDLGVDLGQGWHFGRPLAEATWQPLIGAAPPARRKGETETWS
jgi:EAL domain-containing protein (putative c-di-GMP-specific phosphodiesterase class I)